MSRRAGASKAQRGIWVQGSGFRRTASASPCSPASLSFGVSVERSGFRACRVYGSVVKQARTAMASNIACNIAQRRDAAQRNDIKTGENRSAFLPR